MVETQRAFPARERTCLSTGELLADEHSYRELLRRWSSKDFERHGALQPPPDRHFFETFVYFSALARTNYGEGLRELKTRALAENVGYIETTFRMAPMVADAEFDRATLRAGRDDAALTAQLRGMWATLEQDGTFNQRIDEFVASVEANSAGIDDEQFTMRYQLYVMRLFSPSQVFSAMVSGFKSAMRSPLIVGVNIVGAENNPVSMRDYTLHMKMFRFLKEKYPSVKIALHAGELALGMVPPEGLKFHIDEALTLAGADRIGHGMDLAHESNALGILKTLRDRDIPVEINLTSNHFIFGVKGEAHPVTLYRRYGVPFVISSDDAGVSRNNLSHEYVLFASQYKPDYMELKRLSYNSLRYAFLPDADKKRLLKQLDARFLKFEADMAALSQKAVH